MTVKDIRDGRLDKAVTWLLTLLVAAALTWLTTEIREMRGKIEVLGKSAAVAESAKYGDRIERLAANDAALDKRVTVLETKVR